MKNYFAIIVIATSQARGWATAEQQRIIGYLPTSQVTDHSALDLDQQKLNEQVARRKIANAKRVYEQGGHSFSYAELTLSNLDLGHSFEIGTRVSGTSSSDDVEVSGSLMEPISWPDGTTDNIIVRVQYDTTDNFADYVNCQVGALDALGIANFKGCKLSVF